jgi:hypothetical protein
VIITQPNIFTIFFYEETAPFQYLAFQSQKNAPTYPQQRKANGYFLYYNASLQKKTRFESGS